MTRKFELVFRMIFLFVYGTSMFMPLRDVGADPVSLSLEPDPLLLSAAAPGPDPAPQGYTIAPQDEFTAGDSHTVLVDPMTLASKSPRFGNPSIGLYSSSASAPASTYSFAGGLEIEPITAYNLI